MGEANLPIQQLTKNKTAPTLTSFRVQHVRHLTSSTYILRFDRNNLPFKPGQHLSVGMGTEIQAREYSIYSADNEPFLEILVREVEDGLVSKKLKQCNPGDILRVNGPMGHFSLQSNDIQTKKFVFIATGTGISPFHSIVMSFPSLDYHIVHGVRYAKEAYESHAYESERYTLCTTREKTGDYFGRVTAYLKTYHPDPESLYYLCGNCDMIFEAFDMLTSKGVPTNNIQTEVYF